MEQLADTIRIIAAISFLICLVGLIRPIPLLKIPTRKRAALYLILSYVSYGLAVALSPEPETPEQQTAREGEKQKEALVDSLPDDKEDDEPNNRWEALKAEEIYRRTKDPTYLGDLKTALEEGRRLVSEAEAALNARDYELAKSLSDSAGVNLYRRYKVYYFDSVFMDSLVHPEEEQAKIQFQQAARLSQVVIFREAESEFEDSGALFTKRGSFERLVELAVLWKFRPSEKGEIFRAGLEPVRIIDGKKILDGVKLIKNIDFTDGRLTVSLRAGSDSYNIDIFGDEKITLTHPVRTMKASHSIILNLFNEKRSFYLFPRDLRKEFTKINEVIFVLYFPGKGSGEVVLARYGIKRAKFDLTKNWRKLKAKDGTFQDYLKTHGTYYLHKNMPDKGTPAHILKG